MRYLSPLLLAVVLSCCLSPFQALAGEDQAEPATETERPFAVRASAAYVSGADLEDDRGDMAVTRFKGDASYRFLTLSYIRDSYAWGDVSALPLGNGSDDPWDSLQSVALSASQHGLFDRRWGWFAGGTVFSAFEEQMDGSYGGMVNGGAVYNLSETVQVRGGAMASAHAVGLQALPLLGVDVNRRAEAGWSAALGLPVTEVRYRWPHADAAGAWATRLAASYDSGVYRLADDSPVERKGYVRSKAVLAGLYQDYGLGGFSCTVGLEYRLGRSLDVYDEDGDHTNGYAVDPAPGAMFSLGYAF